MPRFARSVAVLALSLVASAAFAGGSSAPFNYQPDPALKTAPRAELESRIRRTCTATQAEVQNVSQGSLTGPCGCYASRVLHRLDRAEMEAYRNTGLFNDSARVKAIAPRSLASSPAATAVKRRQ